MQHLRFPLDLLYNRGIIMSALFFEQSASGKVQMDDEDSYHVKKRTIPVTNPENMNIIPIATASPLR
jgi:hypothetical protein